MNRSVLSFCTASKETGNTGCEKEKKVKKQQNITQNEYKKINKINIMYKINESLYLSSFILARKTRRKKFLP